MRSLCQTDVRAGLRCQFLAVISPISSNRFGRPKVVYNLKLTLLRFSEWRFAKRPVLLKQLENIALCMKNIYWFIPIANYSLVSNLVYTRRCTIHYLFRCSYLERIFWLVRMTRACFWPTVKLYANQCEQIVLIV